MASNQSNNNNNNNNSSSSSNSKHCAFCRRNKEPEETYKSHQLRKDGLVVCPQLFKHRCELCGATGNNAHTRSYCPLAQNFRRQCQLTKEEDNINNCMPEHAPSDLFKLEPRVFSNMAKVTNTKYNSAGKVRFSYRDQHNQQPGSRPRFTNNRNNNDWNQFNHHHQQQNRSNLNLAATATATSTSHQFMTPFQAQASTSSSSSSSSSLNAINPYWSPALTYDPMLSNQQFNQQQLQPFRRAQTQSRVQRNDRNFAGDSI